MPITDSDLFLIEDTSGVSKKIAASKLKSNLAANTYNNYKLLVNKPDYTSRFVYTQNMQQSVGTTDYMMVERAGVSYKVTGQQIIDYFPSVPAGSAGPITDSTVSNRLTLASNTNLDLFTAGDAIRMVDEDGAVASYTPVTSTITNVSTSTPPDWNIDAKWSDGVTPTRDAENIFDGDPSTYFGTRPYAPGNEVSFTGLPATTIENGISIKSISQSGNTRVFYLDSGGIERMVIVPNTLAVHTPYSPIGSTLTKILWDEGNGGDGCALYHIEINGKMLVDPDAQPLANLLSFASPNPDLKFFNSTTPVQLKNGNTQRAVIYDSFGTWKSISNGPEQAFNGVGTASDPSMPADLDVYAGWNNIRWSDGSEITGIVGVTIQGASSFRDKVTINNPPGNSGGGQLVSLQQSGSVCGNDSAACKTYAETTYLDNLHFYNDVSLEKSAFIYSVVVHYADGSTRCLTAKDFIGDFYHQVISTNLAANTMVVDGGSWTGSDGTSSGVAADRETIVTAQLPKSGTGNFLTNTGPVVDVTNSNEQWIDNTNRLGKEFFIKDASTRTGLAILRSKAIKAATALAQAKEDIRDGDFAIVNNNYWFRDEDTFIDLGPINLPSK